jgi:hypothetical protein
MTTTRQFLTQSYRLISAANPTQPLHGDDLSLGLTVLNQLLQSYASTGLLVTISRTEQTILQIGQREVVCGAASHVPTPDITIGRLANIDSAWLLLEGVTYPFIIQTQAEFNAAWKFDPLQALPRFAILAQETEVTRIRVYPAPSQLYDFFVRGKWQLNQLSANDTMDSLPQYYIRYFLFAVAKDVAMYKGRMEAWTPPLEQMLVEARDQMIAASEMNLSIVGTTASLLNGAYRVRAGV